MRLSEFYKIYSGLFVKRQAVEKIYSYVRDMPMPTVSKVFNCKKCDILFVCAMTENGLVDGSRLTFDTFSRLSILLMRTNFSMMMVSPSRTIQQTTNSSS
jgi:hypothetical protein